MMELEPADPIELIHLTEDHSCEEIVNSLIHELAQPLTTVSAYVGGCIHRLAKGTKDRELLLHAMNKAMQDIECAQQIILQINNYIHQVETN